MNLNDKHLKQDPFEVPQEHLLAIEEKVRESIRIKRAKEERTPSPIMRLKPALMLAMMFGIIGGLGYLASSATERYLQLHATEPDILALIEEGYLKSSFIYSYYDEIDLNAALEQDYVNETEDNAEIELLIENGVTDEEIIYFMETEDNY